MKNPLKIFSRHLKTKLQKRSEKILAKKSWKKNFGAQ